MIVNKLSVIIFAALLFMTSCQKDVDQFIPDPGQPTGPDSTWFNTLLPGMPVNALKASLHLPLQQDSLLLNANTVTVNSASGLRLLLQAGSLLNSNNLPVTGKIKIETLLLRKKGDLIRMGIPTTANGKMLVSGGAFFIRIFNDSSELQLNQNSRLNLRYEDNPVSSLMQLQNGQPALNNIFNWVSNTDTLNNRVLALTQSYEITSTKTGWLGCSYFYDTTGIQRTAVSVVLPSHYTNANSMAFTVFKNLRSVIGMYGNETSRRFSTGLLPVNMEVTVVVISKQGNDYFLGYKNALTTAPASGGNFYQQVTVSPVITSLDNIKAYLNTL